MATPQQYPIDPKLDAKAPLSEVWLRHVDRKRHKDEALLLLHPSTMQREQLRSYAHMEARSWQVAAAKERTSFLEKKWKEAKESIESRCQVLRNAAEAGHALHGEAKALAEHISLFRESMLEVKGALPDVGGLTQVEGTGYRNVPRAYASVASYFRVVNYEFSAETFEQFFMAVQEIAPFEMAELWHLRPFAELLLLEAVAERANAVGASQFAGLGSGREENQGQAETVTRAEILVASLRAISDTDWKELFERINVVEQILRKDPCGAYAQMDFESREVYRKTITQMAKRSKSSEQSIAQTALGLAGRLRRVGNDRITERQSHVGYYLVGGGRRSLEREIGYRRTIAERVQGFVLRWPDFSYILAIELVTFVLIAAAVVGAGVHASGFMLVALLFLPAADCAA